MLCVQMFLVNIYFKPGFTSLTKRSNYMAVPIIGSPLIEGMSCGI